MRFLRDVVPPVLLRAVRKHRELFRGDFASFDHALAHAGVGYDRETVGRTYVEHHERREAPSTFSARNLPLLACFGLLNGSARVLDFGGGSGEWYEVMRALRPDMDLHWDIIETPSVAQFADQLGACETKRFYTDIADVKHRTYDVVINSGTFQVVPEPRALLRELAALNTRFLLFTRLPIAPHLMRDRLTVFDASTFQPGLSFPHWFFSPSFVDEMKRAGDVIAQFAIPEDTVRLDGRDQAMTGVILQKRKAAEAEDGVRRLRCV